MYGELYWLLIIFTTVMQYTSAEFRTLHNLNIKSMLNLMDHFAGDSACTSDEECAYRGICFMGKCNCFGDNCPTSGFWQRCAYQVYYIQTPTHTLHKYSNDVNAHMDNVRQQVKRHYRVRVDAETYAIHIQTCVHVQQQSNIAVTKVRTHARVYHTPNEPCR